MSKKNDTPALLLTFLITAGLLAGDFGGFPDDQGLISANYSPKQLLRLKVRLPLAIPPTRLVDLQAFKLFPRGYSTTEAAPPGHRFGQRLILSFSSPAQSFVCVMSNPLEALLVLVQAFGC